MQIKKAIKKGFTLVELVVVIAVIAILAATSVGVYFGMLESANRSADQQAVVQMNKILQVEDILNGVDSILDVHETLEENGLSPENYTALASDHTFYYDTGYNKILYVKASTYEVEYPEEYNEETYDTRTADGAQWFSLNLTIKETKVNGTGAGTETDPKTYTVGSGEELAYVFSTLENDNNSKNVEITLTKDIDLMGAHLGVSTKAIVNIDGGNHTIRNITSNEVGLHSNQNKDKQWSNYNIGGLFALAENKVTVSNVTFENIYVDGLKNNVGNIGVIAGDARLGVEVNNVKIESSRIAGNRSVAALVGACDKEIKIDGLSLKDVEVRTNGGRSALLVGCMGPENISGLLIVDDFSATNCSYKHVEGATILNNPDSSEYNLKYGYEGLNTYIYNEAKEAAYGYNENAIVNYAVNSPLIKSIDSIEDLNNNY